jgi:hypothetical protein
MDLQQFIEVPLPDDKSKIHQEFSRSDSFGLIRPKLLKPTSAKKWLSLVFSSAGASRAASSRVTTH